MRFDSPYLVNSTTITGSFEVTGTINAGDDSLYDLGTSAKRGNKIVYRPALTSGGAPYGHAYISPNTGTIASYFQHFFTAYDAPGTTSPVTYTIQYRSYAGGTCVFFAASANYASCNFLVATEIAQ